jgi:ElaB/YqjD/DUF883 family membrane-anchored ribosome-binding protein
MSTQVKENLGQIADDAQSLLSATADSTEESVVEARSRLRSAMAAAGETYSRVKEKAVEGAKATDKLIRANPYQAIAIALGAGMLVGYLLSRRNRE